MSLPFSQSHGLDPCVAATREWEQMKGSFFNYPKACVVHFSRDVAFPTFGRAHSIVLQTHSFFSLSASRISHLRYQMKAKSIGFDMMFFSSCIGFDMVLFSPCVDVYLSKNEFEKERRCDLSSG